MNPRTTSRLLRVLGTFAVCASAGIGAQVQVEDAPEPGEGAPIPYSVTGTSFSFTGIAVIPPCSVGATDVLGCTFLNSSGADWTSLMLSINPGTETVFCGALFGYNSCAVQPGSAVTPTVLSFSGGPGIRQGQALAFSGSGWPTLTTFTAVANPAPSEGPAITPEPSAIALMLSGIAVIATLRRRRAD